jgi:hypothetical protein
VYDPHTELGGFGTLFLFHGHRISEKSPAHDSHSSNANRTGGETVLVQKPPIDAATMIPDLLRNAPHVRGVLDRYGLHGCGGKTGPVESLEFFARAHDVSLNDLLGELRIANEFPTEAEATKPSLGDTIYRPFFKSGIAIVLTLGAAWGAYLLLRIGFLGGFRAVGLHEVNAHGHAQIFGWVGLFVMGAGYQAFPRFKHTALVGPRWALASLVLMLIGIISRSIAEPLADAAPALVPVALAGSLLELAAIGIFIALILATLRVASKGLAIYDGYILAALAWFLIQAAYETVYLTATLTAASHEQLVDLVATWQAPLRDIQIHGFALLMILGVSQRVFAPFFGLRAPRQRLSAAALVVLSLAISGEVIGLILMRRSSHAWAALWYGSTLTLAVTVAVLVWDWGIFRKAGHPDRNLKFLRAAYVWLLISLAMLALLPAYQFGLLPWLAPGSAAARLGFSHAYYGAVRHAITVGFISLMIVGMAGKFVPTLNGIDVHRLSGLWFPFVLINLGCAMRVVFQSATDFTDQAFPIAGVSGLLEVAGLAVWGAHIWGLMNGWLRAKSREDDAAGIENEPRPIRGTDRVADVVEKHPYLLDTLLSFGFHPLSNPALRRTLARMVTLEQACRLVGVDIDALLPALNAERFRLGTGTISLPVVEVEEGGCGHMPKGAGNNQTR